MIFVIGQLEPEKLILQLLLPNRLNKQVKRLIFTRPAIEAGENLVLPGSERKARSIYAAYL